MMLLSGVRSSRDIFSMKSFLSFSILPSFSLLRSSSMSWAKSASESLRISSLFSSCSRLRVRRLALERLAAGGEPWRDRGAGQLGRDSSRSSRSAERVRARLGRSHDQRAVHASLAAQGWTHAAACAARSPRARGRQLPDDRSNRSASAPATSGCWRRLLRAASGDREARRRAGADCIVGSSSAGEREHEGQAATPSARCAAPGRAQARPRDGSPAR